MVIVDPVSGPQRVRRIAVAGDRPFDDLREEGEEQGQLRPVVLRRRLAVVDVGQIADGFQREERDADRLHQPGQRAEADPAERIHG